MKILHKITQKLILEVQAKTLQYANLLGVNLQCADLRGADLQGANLQDADLQFAKDTSINITQLLSRVKQLEDDTTETRIYEKHNNERIAALELNRQVILTPSQVHTTGPDSPMANHITATINAWLDTKTIEADITMLKEQTHPPINLIPKIEEYIKHLDHNNTNIALNYHIISVIQNLINKNKLKLNCTL